jgi:hypothetical protein
MTAPIETHTTRRSLPAASDAISAQERVRDGICDSQLATLRDAETISARLRTVGRAVAQMISTDGGSSGIDKGHLHVPYQPLRDVCIGNHRICPNTESDFKPFMDQTCVEASTAVLIGPRHVITTGHSVRIQHIISHQFVFNRTASASHVYANTSTRQWEIPPEHFYTAYRLVAYANTPLADWAILELDRDVEGIKPLDIGHWRSTAKADFFGHPLGLPLTYARVHPLLTSGPTPNYLIDTDAGSGGSGSPIIQSGKVVGIVRGAARIDSEAITSDGLGGRCIDPKRSSCRCPQPFTPARYFAPCVPDIAGW